MLDLVGQKQGGCDKYHQVKQLKLSNSFHQQVQLQPGFLLVLNFSKKKNKKQKLQLKSAFAKLTHKDRFALQHRKRLW